MPWETLAARSGWLVRRRGRFLVVDLLTAHRVLSTSVKNGGQTDHLRHLVNHQSCEGRGHEARSRVILGQGQEAYHDIVCAEIDIAAGDAAVMGTAANMNYAAVVAEQDEDLEVMAVVTAGVQTNAVCAGDPAGWRETGVQGTGSQGAGSKGTGLQGTGLQESGAQATGPRADFVKVAPVAPIVGTINAIVVINLPVTAPTLARAVVTMTEGKSAALQRLAVPSCYSPDLATGTGTDQFCVAAPAAGPRVLTSASPHVKLGELVGLAMRRATIEAVRWQNGLEPSLTRGLFHALGRYGVREQTVFDDLAGLLDPADLELLHHNSKAAFYEPLVGAAAHALAAVMDRVRHQTLPASVAPEAVLQQAAVLAANLAAQPDRWAEFRARLHATGHTELKPLVLAALALGWTEKWRSS